MSNDWSCKICQHQCNGAQGLGLHLAKTHGIKAKDYYDQHLRKPGEGVCTNCGKEQLFDSLGRGYEGKYCSQACMLQGFKQRHQEEERKREDSIPNDKVVECKICGRKWDNLISLGGHISRTHNITTKAYYDLYLKTIETEGVCLECGKPTWFQDLGAGYPNKYCSMACNKAESKRTRLLNEQQERARRKADTQTCRICGRKVIGYKGLSNHVNAKHHIRAKDYYDAYFRKPNEGICEACKKPTRFISFPHGYFRFCSNDCFNKTEKHRADVSIAHKGKPGPNLGKPSPRKGTQLPFEHVKNIRIAAMQRAEEHCRLFGQTFPTRGNNEIPFMDTLQECCPYGIDINFRSCGYVVDGFIHELNLIIEFDEPYHTSPNQQAKDRARENNIKQEYPEIRFWRVPQKTWETNPLEIMTQFKNLVFAESTIHHSPQL